MIFKKATDNSENFWRYLTREGKEWRLWVAVAGYRKAAG
jgi:hypothetical protein